MGNHCDVHLDDLVRQLKPNFKRRHIILREVFGKAYAKVKGNDIDTLMARMSVGVYRVNHGNGPHQVATYYEDGPSQSVLRESMKTNEADPILEALRGIKDKMTSQQKANAASLFGGE